MLRPRPCNRWLKKEGGNAMRVIAVQQSSQRTFVAVNGIQGNRHADEYARSAGCGSPQAPGRRSEPGGKKGQKQQLIALRQVGNGLYPALKAITSGPPVAVLSLAHRRLMRWRSLLRRFYCIRGQGGVLDQRRDIQQPDRHAGVKIEAE